jgi:hypothetical protein
LFDAVKHSGQVGGCTGLLGGNRGRQYYGSSPVSGFSSNKVRVNCMKIETKRGRPRRDQGCRKNPDTAILSTKGDLLVKAVKITLLHEDKDKVDYDSTAKTIARMNDEIRHTRKSKVGSHKSIKNGISKIVNDYLLPAGRIVKIKEGGKTYLTLP